MKFSKAQFIWNKCRPRFIKYLDGKIENLTKMRKVLCEIEF